MALATAKGDFFAGNGEKADLMVCGSLYSMGSCSGGDYAASMVGHLGVAARQDIARPAADTDFTHLCPQPQVAVTGAMRGAVRSIELRKRECGAARHDLGLDGACFLATRIYPFDRRLSGRSLWAKSASQPAE
jgi:hypothetical protein